MAGSFAAALSVVKRLWRRATIARDRVAIELLSLHYAALKARRLHLAADARREEGIDALSPSHFDSRCRVRPRIDDVNGDR